MNNEQYKNLMWHLLYTESLLENISDATASGGDCECPVCKTKIRVFLPFGETPRPNAQCPNCKSLERHRALWLLLQQLNWYRKGMHVLHFAPELIFYRLFTSFKDIDYWSVDLDPKGYGGMVRKQVDITNITFDDNSFDLIMCTHVLEHIPDDKKAMSELYRVLKPKTGIAFLNVPVYDMPQTFENPEINTPELRSKYYGQFDHVRAYGLDYPQRLSEAGFIVHLITMQGFDEKTLKRYGLNKNEKIFLCRKD
ncbi:MAG: methyltransferase domain-containing protein [Selenomonadaceae bacterium]|nr:methyltransferase domain-containing protein [Selenomonadaceae bacterium]